VCPFLNTSRNYNDSLTSAHIAAIVKSTPPRASFDFTIAVEKKGQLDQSPVFYAPKPRREHLLSIKYLGVLRAEGKGGSFDCIVEKNAKRMKAAISIDKPDADAFAWPVTNEDEEADRKRMQREVITNVNCGMLDGEEEEEKHLLIENLLQKFAWEEDQKGSKVTQRLPCETLLWQCRAKYAGDLRYGQGFPHQFLYGPFRARLKQFTNFQKAIMDAIASDKPVLSNEAEVWLAKVPEKLKAQVTDLLSEAREIQNDLVRLRKLSQTCSEFAGRLEENTDDEFGSFGRMYSKILHQKLHDDQRSTHGLNRSRRGIGDPIDHKNKIGIDKDDTDIPSTPKTLGTSLNEHSERVEGFTETLSGTASFQFAIDSCWKNARRSTSSTYTRSTGGRTSQPVDVERHFSPGEHETTLEIDVTKLSASTQWSLVSSDHHSKDIESNGIEVTRPLVYGATLPAPMANPALRGAGISISSVPGQSCKPVLSASPSSQIEDNVPKARAGTLRKWKSLKYSRRSKP
jgi:hypothetical protein